MGWFLAAGGVFTICGAVFNWDWFMNHRKARFFVSIFGRTGTRFFYGILLVVGILMATGALPDAD